jgi:nickel superoxide dismutase
MRILPTLLGTLDRVSAPATVHAHCDLPCGVYDPAQARIEAESVKGCMEKFNASDDDVFKTRAVILK